MFKIELSRGVESCDTRYFLSLLASILRNIRGQSQDDKYAQLINIHQINQTRWHHKQSAGPGLVRGAGSEEKRERTGEGRSLCVGFGGGGGQWEVACRSFKRQGWRNWLWCQHHLSENHDGDFALTEESFPSQATPSPTGAVLPTGCALRLS